LPKRSNRVKEKFEESANYPVFFGSGLFLPQSFHPK